MKSIKKMFALMLAMVMCFSMVTVAGAEQSTYTGTATGFGNQLVTVTVTLEDGKVVSSEIIGSDGKGHGAGAGRHYAARFGAQTRLALEAHHGGTSCRPPRRCGDAQDVGSRDVIYRKTWLCAILSIPSGLYGRRPRECRLLPSWRRRHV